MTTRTALGLLALGLMLVGGGVILLTESGPTPPPARVVVVPPAEGVPTPHFPVLEDTTGDTERTAPDAPSEVDWEALEPGDTVDAKQLWAATGTPTIVKAKRPGQVKGNRIVVPKLNAALPVRRSPVKGGRLDVPPGVSHVGWATNTKGLNAKRGVSVLASHRDTGGGSRGRHSALYDAEGLKKGSKVRIRWNGQTRTYRVAKITWHPRNRLPLRLLKKSGPRRVALLTCGGPLVKGNDGRLRWSKRAVVWMKPAK